MANTDKIYSSDIMKGERKPGFKTPSSDAEAGRSQVRGPPEQLSVTLCQNLKSKKPKAQDIQLASRERERERRKGGDGKDLRRQRREKKEEVEREGQKENTGKIKAQRGTGNKEEYEIHRNQQNSPGSLPLMFDINKLHAPIKRSRAFEWIKNKGVETRKPRPSKVLLPLRNSLQLEGTTQRNRAELEEWIPRKS